MLTKEIQNDTVFVGSTADVRSMIIDTLNPRNKYVLMNLIQTERPDIIYLCNYHYLNHYIAKLSKKYKSMLIYHVHEPYVVERKSVDITQIYWLPIIEFFQGRLLELADYAIISSHTASRLYDIRYPKFRHKKLFIPLLLEDLNRDFKLDVSAKKFITFIGPPVKQKNPEKFIEVVRYSNRRDVGFKFVMTSHSKINNKKYLNEKNLIVVDRLLSDYEFGVLMKKSLVAFVPYKISTQSSVVLTSYMYGTPVIASSVGGLSEIVVHKKTGYLLHPEAEAEEWIEGINYIRYNLEEMSKNCREFFVRNFSDLCWDKYLSVLLKE
ncbi:MAG: glycosyltransferase [Candidatus Micrarchaeota archaeon]|nr:glycosyltransferase [Candidatus Micrarchaeota archaeon]